MAVPLRSRRAHPRARAAARPMPPPDRDVLPGWPAQRVLRDLRDWDALERRCALAQLEAKSYRQLARHYQAERDAARRTLAILAQQALDAEWLTEEETACPRPRTGG